MIHTPKKATASTMRRPTPNGRTCGCLQNLIFGKLLGPEQCLARCQVQRDKPVVINRCKDLAKSVFPGPSSVIAKLDQAQYLVIGAGIT
jgi:hypothetical protein